MLDCKSAIAFRPPVPDYLYPPPATLTHKLTEVTLQLEPRAVTMDRKLFKSPPIARLKSAPKARTEKNIKLGSYTRKDAPSYMRKLSIKGLFSPGRPPPSRQSPVPNSNKCSNYPPSASSSKVRRNNSNASRKKKKAGQKLLELRPPTSKNKVFKSLYFPQKLLELIPPTSKTKVSKIYYFPQKLLELRPPPSKTSLLSYYISHKNCWNSESPLKTRFLSYYTVTHTDNKSLYLLYVLSLPVCRAYIIMVITAGKWLCKQTIV